MLDVLAIAGYRSLRELVVPLGQLTVVSGANGVGKSNLYRALRLLQDTAQGGAIGSLAAEGGLGSALWAGPDQLSRAARRGEAPIQGTIRQKPVSLKIGFSGDGIGYAVEFGLPAPGARFPLAAEIKREVVWAGESYEPGAALADRRSGVVRARDATGRWTDVTDNLAEFDSMLTEIADPRGAPSVLVLRERLRSWRFYDGFRTDAEAPARQTRIGTMTPILGNDGRDAAAALATVRAIGDTRALDQALADAFPGAELELDLADSGQVGFALRQPGLLRPLSQAELSDGTLRYLLWIAALLTPRPPSLMVLNEPETSLHPDLIPALGRLIVKASERTQVWVTTHSTALREHLGRAPRCAALDLDKALGETTVRGQELLDRPPWTWPRR